MAGHRRDLSCVRSPIMSDSAIVVDTLATEGIPAAVWGLAAADHYGGELCLLDIELIINEEDQERVFGLFTSQNVQPAVPANIPGPRPDTFSHWRKASTFYKYQDRCRVRLRTPIYQLPKTGNLLDDHCLPYIILYSAETLGLPRVPPRSDTLYQTSSATHTQLRGYQVIPANSHGGFLPPTADPTPTVLIPTFQNLVRAEVHILLYRTEFLTSVWGQHGAQLSSLLHSWSCVGGIDALDAIVDPSLVDFAHWLQRNLRGVADLAEYSRLRHAHSVDRVP